ncbi:MAG: SDR family oxidoreductase [Verrucomicrobia bacterium]|nr:SDR family oxidoreductase [Verrucomicrobiota bacterium]
MTAYETLQKDLTASPRTWLVTGVAGFIGSNLLERLLQLDQVVTGLDNFATGHQRNLDQVEAAVTPQQWARFHLIEGDIRRRGVCQQACKGVDYVLHQAALGSVPRSLEDPLTTTEVNVNGTVHMFAAARDQRVRRVVYASSSSVYGDDPALPKIESQLGASLSPYAATKLIDEIYAGVFARCYGFESIGLRYFNVFGPRQDPEGPYAAVIPKWIAAMIQNQPVHIHGDGETSRDFCYVANVVQANLLAATTPTPGAVNQPYNVAMNNRTTLNQLYTLLRNLLAPDCPHLNQHQPAYQDFRPGDVRHSQADISRAREFLGYAPTHRIEQGLETALRWYKDNLV